MRRKNRKMFLLVGIVSVFLSAVLFANNTFATIGSADPIREKVYYQDLYDCYITSWLRSSIELDKFNGTLAALIAPGYENTHKPDIGKTGTNIDCQKVATSGFFNMKAANYGFSVDKTELEKHLENMSYEKDESTVTQNSLQCVQFPIKRIDEGKASSFTTTDKICVVGGQSSGYSITTHDAEPKDPDLKFSVVQDSNDRDSITIKAGYGNSPEIRSVTISLKENNRYGRVTKPDVFVIIGNGIAELFKTNKADALHYQNSASYNSKNVYWYSPCSNWKRLAGGGLECTSNSVWNIDFDQDYNATFNKNIGNVISVYSDGKLKYDNLAFTDAETYKLYQSYLTDYYGVKEIYCSNTVDNGKKDYYKAKLWWEEEQKYSKYCYFKVDSSLSGVKVNGIYNNRHWGKEDIDINKIITMLDSLSLSDPPDTTIIDANIDPNNGSAGQYEPDACYSSSGAMGWVICPIVEAASNIGSTFYNMIEKNFLEIPALSVFDETNGVGKAWGTIRDIANTAFVILFLIVIFSQLTGYGIDNYGIKKILPRLIVVAILVNLSLIICELAVDVSNILGAGLNNLLTDAAPGVSVPGMGGGEIAASNLVVGALGSGAVVLFAWLSSGDWAGAAMYIGLAVLGIVIVVLFAIVFLYLILVARQAGVVMCIALAPIAMVLYTLPNTEKISKKWFDLFKALLLVYPICGLMVGGGKFAGAILANIQNPGMRVAAMIVQVLPYFLVPTVLKNSLTLMGNIGARLSNFGRNLGRRVSGGLQSGIRSRVTDSEGYKNYREDLARRRQERSANRTLASTRTDDATVRRKARAQELLKKHNAEDEAAYTALAENKANNMTDGELESQWLEAFKNNDGGDAAQRALVVATNLLRRREGAAASNYMAKEIAKMQSFNGNTNGINSLKTLSRLQSTDSGFARDNLSKAGDLFDMLNKGGIVGRKSEEDGGGLIYGRLGGNANDQDSFTTLNNILKQNKDWATQSAATLQRNIDSGVLTDDIIRSLLNSDDPTIRSGLLSEKSKRNVLEAALAAHQGSNTNGSAAPGEVLTIEHNIGGPDGADGVTE